MKVKLKFTITSISAQLSLGVTTFFCYVRVFMDPNKCFILSIYRYFIKYLRFKVNEKSNLLVQSISHPWVCGDPGIII